MEEKQKPKLDFSLFRTFGEPDLILALDEAKRFVSRLLNDPFNGSGMLSLCGPSGVGKTFLCDVILAELGKNDWGVLSKVKPVLINGRLTAATVTKRDWRRVSDALKGGDYSIVEALEEPFLVFIDDVGADYDPKKIAAGKLDRILRTRARKRTLMTTNLSHQGVGTELDTRIASWMQRDGNVVVEIESEDFSNR